jgi:hypothetical protein
MIKREEEKDIKKKKNTFIFLAHIPSGNQDESLRKSKIALFGPMKKFENKLKQSINLSTQSFGLDFHGKQN